MDNQDMDTNRLYQKFKYGTKDKVGEPGTLDELVPKDALDHIEPVRPFQGKQTLVSYPRPGDKDQDNVFIGECLDQTCPSETTNWWYVLRPVDKASDIAAGSSFEGYHDSLEPAAMATSP